MSSLEQRYAIYCEQARSLGWRVKSFDEWLNSRVDTSQTRPYTI